MNKVALALVMSCIGSIHSKISVEWGLLEYSAYELYAFGKQLQSAGAFHKALPYFKAAVAKDPALQQAGYELAMAHLACRHYTKGFSVLHDYFSELDPLERAWCGENIRGKTIIVRTPRWAINDIFVFGRFVEHLRKEGAQVIFIAYNSVINLFSNVITIADYDGDSYYHSDVSFSAVGYMSGAEKNYQVHLMSIPYLLMLKTKDMNDQNPYLFAPLERQRHWKDQLVCDRNYKIGIYLNDIDMSDLNRICKRSNMSVYALHECHKSENVMCLHTEIRGKDDTFGEIAAIMKNMNLIITNDSTMGDLAGGLGVQVWMMVPAMSNDWRYYNSGSKSVWHPTMRLFRQAIQGNWQSVMQEISEQLSQVVE